MFTASNSQQPTVQARRIQYRVGHGGFHATIVTYDTASFAYVYDVGAAPKKARTVAAIDDLVTRLTRLTVTEVRYVILSHVDADHVNALNELIVALDNAKISHPTVILPWLDPTEKLLALAHANHRQPSAVAVRLAQDTTEVVSYLTQDLGFADVGFLQPADPDPTEDPPTQSRLVASGTDLGSASPLPWTLIATRIPPPTNTLTEFRNLIIKHTGLDPNDAADRDALVMHHRRQIRRAMTAAASATQLTGYGPSVTNWSSICIFGAAPNPASSHPVPVVTATSNLELSCDHGWLHTGDAPLDVQQVWTAFQSAWKQLLPPVQMCTLSAPHHGSPNGHRANLYQTFRPANVTVMAGWRKGSTPALPIYHSKAPVAAKAAASAVGANVIELNNPYP